jgi:hypothetical protein
MQSVSNGFWVEIRPLSTGVFKPGNLLDLFCVLHNTGKPFRIFITTSESTIVKGKRVVRYWLELPTPELQEYVARMLRTYLDVEVIEAEPPKMVYTCYAEFELQKHYALPLWFPGQTPNRNPMDSIFEILASDWGVLELIAKGDHSAKRGIYSYVWRQIYPRCSFTKTITDLCIGMISEVGTQKYGKVSLKETLRSEQFSKDPQRKAHVEAALRKLQQPLLTCRIRIYGNKQTIEMLKNSIPGVLNRLIRWKTVRKHVKTPDKLTTPTKHILRNLFSHFWKIAPILMLIIAWQLHVFNPLRLELFDITAALLVITVAVIAGILFRRKNPIILSVEEMALIGSLPTAIGRLSIEFGAIPPTRKPLAKP